MPQVPVRDIAVFPGNSAWLYVATEVGLFTSDDGGATWDLTMDGPANVSVDELFWLGNSLYAVTYGRGVFKTTPLATNPVPTLSSVSPTSFTIGTPGRTFTVTGTNFVGSSVVQVDGVSRATTYVSATQLSAQLTAGEMTSPQSFTVTVFNPTPAGGTSSSATVQVVAPQAPTVSSLSPTSVWVASNNLSVVVTGANYTTNSVVYFDGSARTTSYGSSTQLTATLQTADIATKGVHAISVVTPSPGGGVSSGAAFTVVGPSLSVGATLVATGKPVTVTLTGGRGIKTDWMAVAAVGSASTSYTSKVVVGAYTSKTWNAPMPTTPGTYEVRLFAGGGYTQLEVSSAITVVRPNLKPTVSSLSTKKVIAGSNGFTEMLTGRNFLPSSVVNVDGVARSTTYISPTQLSVDVSMADIAAAGAIRFSVTSPAPGGGTSTALTLTISPQPPVPAITGFSPSKVVAANVGRTLTVTGSGFISSSTVLVDGSPRATLFRTSSQLVVTLLAGDVATIGTRSIQVVTPPPGGGTSAPRALTVAVR